MIVQLRNARTAFAAGVHSPVVFVFWIASVLQRLHTRSRNETFRNRSHNAIELRPIRQHRP